MKGARHMNELAGLTCRGATLNRNRGGVEAPYFRGRSAPLGPLSPEDVTSGASTVQVRAGRASAHVCNPPAVSFASSAVFSMVLNPGASCIRL